MFGGGCGRGFGGGRRSGDVDGGGVLVLSTGTLLQSFRSVLEVRGEYRVLCPA